MGEHEEQVALFAWADLMMNRYPDLEFMYAVPNGSKMGFYRKNGKVVSPQGMYMKAEGRKKGVPDIVLPAARGGFFGLYIEMKFGSNALKADQRRYIAYLKAQGYKVVVPYSFEEARHSIEEYLEEERTVVKWKTE